MEPEEKSSELANREVVGDLKAAIEARRELDPDLEDHLLTSFLTRIQNRVDTRVDERLAAKGGRPSGMKGDRVQVEIVAGSFALAIPLLAIAGGIAGGFGVFAVIAGLVCVNLLYFIDRWVRMS